MSCGGGGCGGGGGGKVPANHPFGTFPAPPKHNPDPTELNYLCRYEVSNSARVKQVTRKKIEETKTIS